MGDIERLKELLARIEKATGPDRLFAEHVVQIVADLGPTSAQDWIAAHGQPDASIDAALALVERCLPGWRVRQLFQHGARADGGLKGWWACEIWEDRHAGSGTGRQSAPTAPLAILAALLRALIANQQESA